MILREYRLDDPAQVRAVMQLNNQDLNIALGLVYAHNARVSEAAYIKKLHRSRGTTLWEHRRVDHAIAQKHALRARLKQILNLHGMRILYGTGGRIESLIFKKTRRSAPRPTGGVFSVSQEALFPFSDMYSEERFNEWIVNRVITAETT